MAKNSDYNIWSYRWAKRTTDYSGQLEIDWLNYYKTSLDQHKLLQLIILPKTSSSGSIWPLSLTWHPNIQSVANELLIATEMTEGDILSICTRSRTKNTESDSGTKPDYSCQNCSDWLDAWHRLWAKAVMVSVLPRLMFTLLEDTTVVRRL